MTERKASAKASAKAKASANTEVSPLRRQKAPPPVEMTILRWWAFVTFFNFTKWRGVIRPLYEGYFRLCFRGVWEFSTGWGA
jgi:hypothetical protein